MKDTFNTLQELTQTLNAQKGNPTYTEHDLELARWRGAVTQALKDIHDDIVATNKRMDSIERRLTSAQVKMAGIGGTVALVVTLVVLLLRSLL